MKKILLTLITLSLIPGLVFSQKNESTYSYLKAFKTAFYKDGATSTRSASGKPGSQYWQNRADYIIDVELDTLSDIIMGKEIIKYTNNSPDEMDFLWLHMDQNIFKEDSRGNAIIPLNGSRNGSKGQKLDGGFKISAVQIIPERGSKNRTIIDLKHEIYDTRMKVVLPEPLKANGGKLSLKIDFSNCNSSFD